MPKKPKGNPAAAVDLAAFAAIQIRSNMRMLAEVRALRVLVTQHIAQVLAVQALAATPDATNDDRLKSEAEFSRQIEQKLDSLTKRLLQKFYEHAEDEDPSLAASLDDRMPEDIEPDPG